MFSTRWIPRFIGLMLLLGSGVLRGAEKMPDWVAAALAPPLSVPVGGADAVVVLDEGALTVAADGLLTTRTRWIVKILTRDGRYHAAAFARYNATGGKVKSLRAWRVPQRGPVVAFGKPHIVDAAEHLNALELYSEGRVQRITAAVNDVVPGDHFAYEAVVERRSRNLAELWFFQDDLPVQRSAFSLTLPAGWQVASRVSHAPGLEPQLSGQTRTWMLRDLRPLDHEDYAPPRLSYVPWLALDLQPPPALAQKLDRIPQDSWPALSRYFTPAYDRASEPDASVTARALALTAGATTRWERIRALSRFVQDVNYISIALNLEQAGGYFPRPAAEVLKVNYGDCKDKSTLLRALLRAAGIRSHPLIIHSGDPDQVDPQWTSPLQFNHCILAIEADDSVPVASTIEAPGIGRLFLFDATDTHTPPGQLAVTTLSRHALLLAGERGDLITLATITPPPARRERSLTGRIDHLGSIEVQLVEKLSGSSARWALREFRERSPSEFRDLIVRWLGTTLSAPEVKKLTPVSAFDEGRFTLEVDLVAPAYGKKMQNVLLVFKPAMLSRLEHPGVKKAERFQPLRIPQWAFRETTTLTLPEDFRVDELPPPVALERPFGTYTARTAVTAGTLTYERVLELHATQLPAADADQVRQFYEQIAQAEQTPVVLEKL